jgi:hypothetical protein
VVGQLGNGLVLQLLGRPAPWPLQWLKRLCRKAIRNTGAVNASLTRSKLQRSGRSRPLVPTLLVMAANAATQARSLNYWFPVALRPRAPSSRAKLSAMPSNR